MLAARLPTLSAALLWRSATAFAPVAARVRTSTALFSGGGPLGVRGDGGGGDGITVYGTQAIADGAAPKLTIFWLHGLGDTADGWAGAFAGGGVEAPVAEYKVVLPTAATAPVSLNGGAAMPSWFDVYGLDPSDRVDEGGVAAAAERLAKLVDAEDASTAVVIGGFSQGGAVALTCGLRSSNENVRALVGFSTWLPLAESYPGALAEGAAGRVPIALYHGDEDLTVRTSWGEASRDALRDLGFSTEWRAFEGMAHSACAEEFAAVSAFLRKIEL